VETPLLTRLCLPQSPRGINLVLVLYNSIPVVSTLNDVMRRDIICPFHQVLLDQWPEDPRIVLAVWQIGPIGVINRWLQADYKILDSYS